MNKVGVLMKIDNKTLTKYLAEVKRIEESRSKNADKKIRSLYKTLLKNLNGFIGEYYTKYADNDGILNGAILQQKAKYASFLEEVDKNIKEITPDISKTIKSTVESSYKACYEGMINGFSKSFDSFKDSFKGLSIKPEVIKAAVENPISGLTLPERLQKHRQDIIYDIKSSITNALMTGERYDTTTKKLAERLDVSYGKANRIVRTESHRVQEKGLLDGAEKIGEKVKNDGLVYAVIWRNMGDIKVRPNIRVHTSKGWKTYKSKTKANHIKMEGQVVEAGGYFDLGNGVKAKSPGESGTPENDCNCRCTLEYEMMTVEEFEERGGRWKNEKGIVKNREEEYNEIEEGTTKLKFAMAEDDYVDYINLINNNPNSSVKNLYKKYGDGVSEITCIPNGGGYNPGNNTLEFGYDDGLTYEGIHKFSTLAHEYGHYFDNAVTFDTLNYKEVDLLNSRVVLGSGVFNFFERIPSSSDEFLDAMRKDKQFIKSIWSNKIQEELYEHHSSAGVQDAIDGMFSYRIRWGHGDTYYNRKYKRIKKFAKHKELQQAYKELGYDATSQTKVMNIVRNYETASEMWANIMSAEICGGEELEYVKRYLPNSYAMLLKIIKGVQ